MPKLYIRQCPIHSRAKLVTLIQQGKSQMIFNTYTTIFKIEQPTYFCCRLCKDHMTTFPIFTNVGSTQMPCLYFISGMSRCLSSRTTDVMQASRIASYFSGLWAIYIVFYFVSLLTNYSFLVGQPLYKKWSPLFSIVIVYP